MSNNKHEKARLLIDYFHRLMMHHAMWFGEVVHQYGREAAWDILRNAYDKTYEIQMKRLARVLGYELEDDGAGDLPGMVPKPLLEMPEEQLDSLMEGIAVNWLATDGVWFQSVEFSRGMSEAKRINDSCWAQFSPFEAWSIKRFLGLSDRPGLEGLKNALQYRLYAAVNKQSIVDETESSFVFRMNDCRVQSARKRKGLDDYPCKSGGLIEYTSFASTIDPGIKTECIACPPDPHPGEYYCAWRFSV